jgi:hypothetical protein
VDRCQQLTQVVRDTPDTLEVPDPPACTCTIWPPYTKIFGFEPDDLEEKFATLVDVRVRGDDTINVCRSLARVAEP